MPVAMTFTSLTADVVAYLERGGTLDTTVRNQIPSLINMAERNIAREMKIQGFIQVVTTVFASGTSVYLKPDRWRQTVSMYYGTGQARKALFPREYGYCRAYWPDQTQIAAPKFYAEYDYNHWLVTPTPDAAYNVEVIYYELPALLDSVTSTNWLTDYAPNILLYRTLLETAIFLKDTAQQAVFSGLYQEALGALNEEDMGKIIDRTTTRREA